MAFGKVFGTRKEANQHLEKVQVRSDEGGLGVRKMSKKVFPRRKKLFHVGTFIDFLNFT